MNASEEFLGQRDASRDPSDLTPAQHQFALEYVCNGFNATAAYRAAHPNVTYATARMEGSRCLAHPCVRAFLDPQLQSRWKALQPDGDEALGRIALDARADLRLLFDEKGELLKPHEWPDDIANSIESVELRADGGVKVRLTGKLTARRIILEQTGKLSLRLRTESMPWPRRFSLTSIVARRDERASQTPLHAAVLRVGLVQR